jgi:indolepyruvate ferredoxin oxidoreductase beta subunit
MEALRQMKFLGNSEVMVLSNTKIVQPADVLAGKVTYPDLAELESAITALSGRAWFVPATDIALDLGYAIVSNIIMLGALVGTKTMPISLAQAENEVRATIPNPQIELNLEALNRGYQTTLGAEAA